MVLYYGHNIVAWEETINERATFMEPMPFWFPTRKNYLGLDTFIVHTIEGKMSILDMDITTHMPSLPYPTVNPTT